VLPYFRKSENFEPGGDESRGRGGPLNVAHMIERHEILDAIIDAAEAEGIPRNPDYNNGNQEGFGYYQVTQKDGRRWSTARAFLDPARARPNLHVETEAHATSLLLEGKRCVGVAYKQRGESREARAGIEVVLAAGAVQSPQLLELSGIGQPELLGAHGIAVRHALPGVGENYRDHFCPRMNWRVKLPITLNEQSRGLSFVREVLKYFTQRKGILTYTAGIIYGFARTRPELAEPDVQYHFAHASYATAATRVLDREPGMTLAVYQCRPESKGSIHIRSADPFAKPVIRPNFLADPIDQQTVVAGLKLGRRLRDEPRGGGDVRRGHAGIRARQRPDDLPRDRHLQDGQRSDGGGGRPAAGAWAGRAARGRCLDHADDGFGQYQRRDHHDRREGCGPDQGRRQRGTARRRLTARFCRGKGADERRGGDDRARCARRGDGDDRPAGEAERDERRGGARADCGDRRPARR
jgi:choline dehydrogenase-like flavoprotein